MRRFFSFWWMCAQRAFWGNTAFANDWQWLFGIPVLSGVGVFLASKEATELSTGFPILDGVLAALGAFVITWLIAFIVRFANAPSALFYQEKERADELEKLKQIAEEARAPSFDLGFEVTKIDAAEVARPKQDRIFFKPQEICRIWVENVDFGPIGDCRLVVEDIQPSCGVKRGELLVPDNMADENPSAAIFEMAATERRYFRFLKLQSRIGSEELAVCLRTNAQKVDYLDVRCLDFGKRYFVTLAVHGQNAGSRRTTLIIDVKSETDVRIFEDRESAIPHEETSHGTRQIPQS